MLLRAGMSPRAAHGRCQKEPIHLNKTPNQTSSNTERAGSNINTTALVTQKEQQAGDLACCIKSSHTRGPEWTIFIVILCKYQWVSLKWCHICRYQLLEFTYGTKPPQRHSSLQALHQLICSVLWRKVKEIPCKDEYLPSSIDKINMSELQKLQVHHPGSVSDICISNALWKKYAQHQTVICTILTSPSLPCAKHVHTEKQILSKSKSTGFTGNLNTPEDHFSKIKSNSWHKN